MELFHTGEALPGSDPGTFLHSINYSDSDFQVVPVLFPFLIGREENGAVHSILSSELAVVPSTRATTSYLVSDPETPFQNTYLHSSLHFQVVPELFPLLGKHAYPLLVNSKGQKGK